MKNDSLGILAAGCSYFGALSVGQILQSAMRINTGLPALATFGSVVTLIAGLCVSWETAEQICGGSNVVEQFFDAHKMYLLKAHPQDVELPYPV